MRNVSLALVGGAVGLVMLLGVIPAADVPSVQPAEGRVLSLTVPALDLNLLGLNFETSPITVNANAAEELRVTGGTSQQRGRLRSVSAALQRQW